MHSVPSEIFLNTIKAHNLNNHFPKNEINVLCTFRDIKCQSLIDGKTGIEYIKQMTYAVGLLMLKSVIMHSVVDK